MEDIYYNKRTVFVLIVIVSIQVSLRSQIPRRDILFTYGFSWGGFGLAHSPSMKTIDGSGLKQTTGLVSAKNGRGGYNSTGKRTWGLNFGWMIENKNRTSWWGFGFDIQHNRNAFVFDLPFQKKVPVEIRGGDGDADDPIIGYDTNIVSTGTWMETNKYLKLAANIQYMWQLKNFSMYTNGQKFGYIKMSAGQSFFQRNNGRLLKVGQTEEAEDDKGNRITSINTAFSPMRYIISSEIGIYSFSRDKRHSLSFGLSWNHPIDGNFVKEYEFFTKKAGKTSNPGPYEPIGKQAITFYGGTVLLNVTYSFNSKLKRRPLDTLKFEEVKDPPKEIVAHVHKPHSLNGRKVKMKETIEVSDTSITIFVWDKGKIDGDRIELYLNGTQILPDYTVGKNKKEVALHLLPGKNYLVMHALNLGRVPPNTAAIKIMDGSKEKTIILNSDTNESGAIELICPK
jgi:hypothetical protein